MNILIIGSCAREYSIIKKLAIDNNKLYCIGDNKNPGILEFTDVIYNTSYLDSKKLVLFCYSNKINMVVIGPEKYLDMGITDILEKNNIKCIGPTKQLAKIETDKYFARNLLQENFLGSFNPKYKYFRSLKTLDEIESYYSFCKTLGFSYVIKPTGLNSGKGVKVSGVHFKNDLEGFLYSLETIQNGQCILIEEKLIGKEFTFMSYSDGITTADMPVVVDFKLLESGNKGPNTGSMGCISYSDHKAPFLKDSDIMVASNINRNVISILGKNGCKYKGIIYGSYIKCDNGDIKLIEFNARYGDPECVNVLELLDTSLFQIFKSIINEDLSKVSINYKKTNIVSKYLVPKNYPEKSTEIYTIDNQWYTSNEKNIIPSSLNYVNNTISSTSSRTLVYFKTGQNLHEITDCINKNINVKNFKYREDIGNSGCTYKNSGVDIVKSTEIVTSMKPFIHKTLNKNCIHKQGDFSGIIDIPKNYDNPVLISSIDGVGSKPSFLYKYNENAYKIAGKDIVAHSINDILVKGAEPLYFLDYIACEKLDTAKILDVVEGMTDLCKQYNCPLVGGETAEMPKIYNTGEIDIAGCITGIAEKDNIIEGKDNININDHVIGLYSNGLHTNGFSLIRSIFKNEKLNKPFLEWISQPHTCYLDEIKLLKDVKVNALVHITGGGLVDNPPRVLPEKMCMNIYKENLLNEHFYFIQQSGNIDDLEMYRTFNCGIGMMIILDEPNYKKATEIFKNNHINFCRLGYISKRNKENVNFI